MGTGGTDGQALKFLVFFISCKSLLIFVKELIKFINGQFRLVALNMILQSGKQEISAFKGSVLLGEDDLFIEKIVF